MAEKQLIVAVEGTAAVGPYWQTIVTDYLEKIIRCFCGNELNGQKLSGTKPELALVVFNTHGPYSAFLVQRTGWTKDMDVFLQWLSGVPFGGGGFCDAAIAEGLGEALMMFPVHANGAQNHQNLDAQKHCILIAASNPYPLATPVYRPLIPGSEHNEKAEGQSETCLADAETVAKSFGLCSVSLSVISPKQLPKLRAIYNAGKRNPRASDPTIDHLKNPHFLVLLSDNFMEARAALSRPVIGNIAQNQSITKVDGTPPPVQGPASNLSSVNGSMINRQPVPVGNNSITVKQEPTTMPSVVPGSGYPQLSAISNVASQTIPSLQTSSPSPTSQEMNNTASENAQELKPLVNPQQSVRPIGPANVNILNNLSQHRQMMSATISGASSIGLQTMGGTSMAMHMSNMISTGMPSSAMAGITSMATSQLAQNTALGSFTSATSNMAANSNMGISSAMSNMGMGQVGQGGIGLNQNIMSNLSAPPSMSSGPGNMIPTPGMSQPGSVNSLGLNPNSTMSMPMAPHASGVQQSQSKYVKIWEGALSGQRQGQPVHICRLEAYRSIQASESLAADWPPSMQIVRLIAQDHMNNKQYVGKADFLVFRTLNQHGFLGQLQEKKLCAVIQLPSQTLLLSVSDKAARMIGMLFPGDMVVFKPQVSGQQQQQLNQQQQQQQLNQQQQQHLQQQQQQQQQQMVGQAFVQGPGPGRAQIMSQGKMPPQGGPGNMGGGGFMS